MSEATATTQADGGIGMFIRQMQAEAVEDSMILAGLARRADQRARSIASLAAAVAEGVKNRAQAPAAEAAAKNTKGQTA